MGILIDGSSLVWVFSIAKIVSLFGSNLKVPLRRCFWKGQIAGSGFGITQLWRVLTDSGTNVRWYDTVWCIFTGVFGSEHILFVAYCDSTYSGMQRKASASSNRS